MKAVTSPYELGKQLAKEAGTVRDILSATGKGGLAGAGIGGLAGLGAGTAGAMITPGEVKGRWLMPLIAALNGMAIGAPTGAGLGATYGVTRTGVRHALRDADEDRKNKADDNEESTH